MKLSTFKNINLKAWRNSSIDSFFKNDEITIFHHIHKTAGTSLEAVLSKWFILHRDFNLEKVNKLNHYKNCHCLSGHYGYHNIHLKELYPEIWKEFSKHKVFTFIREPLDRSISHFYHWKKAGFEGYQKLDLIDYLAGKAETNYINEVSSNWTAKVLNIEENNLEETLNRYFFVGLFEELQNSINILSEMLNKPNYELPKKRRGFYKKSNKIPDDVIEIFKNRNQLDYEIYKYGLLKFKEY